MTAGAGVLAVAVALAWSGVDRTLADRLVEARPEEMIRFAKAVSRWGELHLAPLLALGLLGGLGYANGRARWIWAAVAGVMGGATAGLVALGLKALLGRPRPYLHIADGLTWFARHNDHQSFPSGHTTHCFGVAVAVLVLAPRWGFGFVAGAALVAWSRMYLGSHYLSDVVAGAALGTLGGGVLALAVRRWLDTRTLEKPTSID